MLSERRRFARRCHGFFEGCKPLARSTTRDERVLDFGQGGQHRCAVILQRAIQGRAACLDVGLDAARVEDRPSDAHNEIGRGFFGAENFLHRERIDAERASQIERRITPRF